MGTKIGKAQIPSDFSGNGFQSTHIIYFYKTNVL